MLQFSLCLAKVCAPASSLRDLYRVSHSSAQSLPVATFPSSMSCLPAASHSFPSGHIELCFFWAVPTVFVSAHIAPLVLKYSTFKHFYKCRPTKTSWKDSTVNALTPLDSPIHTCHLCCIILPPSLLAHR